MSEEELKKTRDVYVGGILYLKYWHSTSLACSLINAVVIRSGAAINLWEAKNTNAPTQKLSRWQDETVQYSRYSLLSSTQIAVINLFRLNRNRLPLWDFVDMSVIEIFNFARWAVTHICLLSEKRTCTQREWRIIHELFDPDRYVTL